MSDADESVLVTGGSGFLGGWCVIELLRRGYPVRTTVRSPAREAGLRARIAAETDPEDRLSVHVADLTDDSGWTAAVDGCPYVLHVASPFPPAQPKDPDELIIPARDGTLRVLRAGLDSGVRRVVVTSSVAAIRGLREDPQQRPLTEDDWTDPTLAHLSPYVRSKTIAERAAWDLAAEAGESDRLAVINPVAIIGPVLDGDRSYSLQVIERLLKGMPGVPRLGFSFVDVRDVAALEIEAMTAPGAGGERLIASGPFLWMAEVAQILRDRLGADARKVPRRQIPDVLVRAMGRFDPSIRSVVSDLGHKVTYSTDKATRLLGWSARPIDDTIADCARSIRLHAPARG